MNSTASKKCFRYIFRHTDEVFERWKTTLGFRPDANNPDLLQDDSHVVPGATQNLILLVSLVLFRQLCPCISSFFMCPIIGSTAFLWLSRHFSLAFTSASDRKWRPANQTLCDHGPRTLLPASFRWSAQLDWAELPTPWPLYGSTGNARSPTKKLLRLVTATSTSTSNS